MSDIRGTEGTPGGFPAGGIPFNLRGFTSSDVDLLRSAHRFGMADRGWGRAAFALNDFSQYLAIWERDAATDAEPAVQIVRFAKTGTYALLKRGRILANDKRLGAILPVLAAVER